MENVKTEVKGSILTITIDLSKEYGETGSGKSIKVASTGSAQMVAPGIMMGLNVYKKKA